MTALHWIVEAACAWLLFVVARAGLRRLYHLADAAIAAALDRKWEWEDCDDHPACQDIRAIRGQQ